MNMQLAKVCHHSGLNTHKTLSNIRGLPSSVECGFANVCMGCRIAMGLSKCVILTLSALSRV